MDWGKVVYVFFTLMSLTSTAGFLFEYFFIFIYICNTVPVFCEVVSKSMGLMYS